VEDSVCTFFISSEVVVVAKKYISYKTEKYITKKSEFYDTFAHFLN